MSEENKTPKAKKSAEPKAPVKPTTVIFRSADPEAMQFEIRGENASRCQDGRIEWEFSAEEAELVRRHFHIESGRVVEV